MYTSHLKPKETLHTSMQKEHFLCKCKRDTSYVNAKGNFLCQTQRVTFLCPKKGTFYVNSKGTLPM